MSLRDWSSDVCSSDLSVQHREPLRPEWRSAERRVRTTNQPSESGVRIRRSTGISTSGSRQFLISLAKHAPRLSDKQSASPGQTSVPYLSGHVYLSASYSRPEVRSGKLLHFWEQSIAPDHRKNRQVTTTILGRVLLQALRKSRPRKVEARCHICGRSIQHYWKVYDNLYLLRWAHTTAEGQAYCPYLETMEIRPEKESAVELRIPFHWKHVT